MDLKKVKPDPIDLSNWAFGPIELNDDVIAEAVADAIDTTFRDDPPFLTLPYFWAPGCDGNGGPAVEDPLTIYLHLPFSADGDGIILFGSFREMVDDFMDGSSKEQCGAIAMALGEMMEKLIQASKEEDRR